MKRAPAWTCVLVTTAGALAACGDNGATGVDSNSTPSFGTADDHSDVAPAWGIDDDRCDPALAVVADDGYGLVTVVNSFNAGAGAGSSDSVLCTFGPRHPPKSGEASERTFRVSQTGSVQEQGAEVTVP